MLKCEICLQDTCLILDKIFLHNYYNCKYSKEYTKYGILKYGHLICLG